MSTASLTRRSSWAHTTAGAGGEADASPWHVGSADDRAASGACPHISGITLTPETFPDLPGSHPAAVAMR
ncbi:hypothetical protein FOA52_008755 [Chlamydomonas sp. UWO 241]|nr:hypothetical protein FOA52_008755 [Chlamydomonas sp. UWO 241]